MTAKREDHRDMVRAEAVLQDVDQCPRRRPSVKKVPRGQAAETPVNPRQGVVPTVGGGPVGEIITTDVDIPLEVVSIDMGVLGRLEADSSTHSGVLAFLRDIAVEVANHKCQTISPTSAGS